MQYSDMNRERRQTIKRGGTDAMIGRGVRKAVNTIKNIPNTVSSMASKTTEKMANKVIKGKWWNS